LIDGEVCVLTNIDLEHTEILGATRAAIAREKVAIAKRGATLVTGVRADDEVAPILRAHAREVAGTDVVWALGASNGTLAELNRALASAALDALAARGVIATGGALLSAEVCARAGLPGRMEVLEWKGLTVVLDGAHVPSSLAAVLRELGTRPEFARPPVVVFGTGKDKDVTGLLKVLGARVDRLICTSVGSQTAVPPGELVENAKRFVVGAQSASTPRSAFDQARALCSLGDWVLVTGSLHLIGAVRPLLRAAP
jgi:dihydrofolate synthase/folylpolyglutamate synthase